MGTGDARVTKTLGVSLKKGTYQNKPPKDEKYIILDSDGTIKQYNDDGTKSAFGGGGGVAALVQGTGIAIDATDPTHPIVSQAATYNKFERDAYAAGLIINPTGFDGYEVRYPGFGSLPIATAASAAESNTRGGALSQAGTAWFYEHLVLSTQQKTAKWMLAFRAKYGAQSAGSVADFGFTSTTANLSVSSRQADSATNWEIRVTDGTPTTAVGVKALDTLWHTFAFGYNGTNIVLLIDGVLDATLSDLTHVSEGNMRVFLSQGAAGTALVTKIMFAYMEP